MRFKVFVLISFSALFFIQRSVSQDYIVKTNGDTLHCTVTKIDSNAIYFRIDLNSQKIDTWLSADKIQSFYVPVLPDNPARITCEKKMMRYGRLSGAGGTLMVIGLASVIYGISSGAEIYTTETSIIATGQSKQEQNGAVAFTLGVPVLIGGTTMFLIGRSKYDKYRKMLKELYNLSLDIEHYGEYNGISLTYRF